MSPKPHVGIIGAGLSGLRCADVLVQNGAQVTILEARDRLGGRVHQAELEGRLVDLGPNWIHGARESPIMAIAEKTQTIARDPDIQPIAFSRDGEPVSEYNTGLISEAVWTTIDKAFEYSNKNKHTIPPERSLYDFFKETVKETSLSPEEEQLLLDACKLWGAYVGEPIERQSLKFFHLEECIDGNNFFVASTYKRILEYVAKAAQSDATIKLNQKVVKIDTSNDQISITTSAGETHTFDEVVVTCPLGWLKNNLSAFTPALPAPLTSAIKSISYGRLEKVFVRFPRAFWQPDTGTAKPFFAQFLEPNYVEHPAGVEWNQECMSLASLPKGAQPTSLFYTYGPSGAHIVSRIADLDPASQEYRDTLIGFLEPFYARLPGYNALSKDCVPSAILATKWQTDELAGYGSYSNFQVGLEQGEKISR
ncbi:hypothetical protein N7470_010109 [Penicillium chermesinum]|nr:hypothetical protein N7470_010109 [Penicillium chermesinum]